MVQKLPDEQVNFSQEHPLKDVLQMLCVVVIGVIVFFIGVSVLSDWLVPKMSFRYEKAFFSKFKLSSEPSVLDKKNLYYQSINTLLQSLAQNSGFKIGDIELSVACKNENNAMAYPGGKIVVYKGLLKQVDSENELAMVLGHELGHIIHRDHLRGLGLGVSLSVLSLFLPENLNDALIKQLNEWLMSKHSRIQEQAADYIGADLVYQRYGHSKGMVDFFKKMRLKDEKLGFAYQNRWTSSHPLSEQRVKHLNQYIKNNAWLELERKSYDPNYWDMLCQSKS